MKNLLLLFLMALSTLSFAQEFSTALLADLPMNCSNNAVAEGFINGKSYVYSFGGIDESKNWSGIHLRSFRLDVEANEWEEIAALPDDEGKIASSASRVGEIIYVIGGYHVSATGSEVSSNKVHRYDIINNVFLDDGAPIPVPIDDQVQVVRGHLIYVVTGWSTSGNVTDVQIYDTIENSWSVGTDLFNGNNYIAFGASGAMINDTLFYYGGAQGLNFAAKNILRKGAVDSVDPTNISWTRVTPDGSPDSYRSAAFIVDDRACWAGGSEVSYNFDGIAYNGSGGVSPTNKIVCFDNASQSWDQFDLTLPMDLRSLATLSDSTFVIVGGMTENQQVTNETLLLTYESPSFITQVSPEPSMSIYPSIVKNNLNVRFSDANSLERKIEIRDMNGMKVMERTISTLSQELNVSELTSGAYLLTSEAEALQFIKVD